MLMAILMLWGSGCVLSFGTHLSAFGFWRIMDGAAVMCCTPREIPTWRFMHGALLGVYHGRITVGTRIGIFPRKRGLKEDIFIKTYLMVTFITKTAPLLQSSLDSTLGKSHPVTLSKSVVLVTLCSILI
jgi:hypothetical protein